LPYAVVVGNTENGIIYLIDSPYARLVPKPGGQAA